jgi:glycosyltransferase involved in cell wall biosynthesis
MMKFSLIMATCDRKDEVENFINSLLVQTHKNFELVLVDQNEDNRVHEIYSRYQGTIAIKYIQSGKKGLSLNRNIGLDSCDGDIIAFPDDDCEYAIDTLEKAARFFDLNHGYCFYTCNTQDKNSNGSILNTNSKDADISIFNLFYVGISFTIFVRASALAAFYFDEQLGIGTNFGSAEESDLLLFLLYSGYKGRYLAENYIFHPAKEETPEKAFRYGKGFGAVNKKAVLKYRFGGLFPVFILRLIKGIINIVFLGNKKMRIASLHGRILGFILFKIQQKP